MAKKGNIPWNKGKKNWLVLSDDARKKISLSSKGKKRPPCSEEWIRKLSLARRGKKHNEETKKRMSEWMKTHPNKGQFKKGDKPKNTGIRSGKYTISRWHPDYEYALTVRKDHCDICKIPEKGQKKKLAFDHDHSTDRFRGWLCMSCNLTLGQVGDKPELLIKMIKYLNKNKND